VEAVTKNKSLLSQGILKRTNTVADNLILTSVETVWHVHEHAATDSLEHEEHEEHAEHDSTFVASRLIPTHQAGDSTKEVTSLLIQYRSPMAAIQLPRMINGESKLQAASPAFETARLFSILGVGVDILTGFAYVLIFISALSVFIALYNSSKRKTIRPGHHAVDGRIKKQTVYECFAGGSCLNYPRQRLRAFAWARSFGDL
jgi:putative ABC transport system permease protein